MTVHGLWGRRLARVRQAPGRKILVYGNHEITSTGLVETNGFDEVHSSLYVEGDPPLLLTHVPLRVVPGSCVNIHGHLHHTHVPGKTRHINVCVEQLQYRPKALSARQPREPAGDLDWTCATGARNGSWPHLHRRSRFARPAPKGRPSKSCVRRCFGDQRNQDVVTNVVSKASTQTTRLFSTGYAQPRSSGDRAAARELRSTGRGRYGRSSPAAPRSRQTQPRRSRPDARCGGRTGSSGTARAATGRGPAAPRRTWRRPAAWSCRGRGCRPSAAPSGPDTPGRRRGGVAALALLVPLAAPTSAQTNLADLMQQKLERAQQRFEAGQGRRRR